MKPKHLLFLFTLVALFFVAACGGAVGVEPTANPLAHPAAPAEDDAVQIDPYTRARQLVEQVEPVAPEGLTVTACEGEAAVLCISDGSKDVGYAELLVFPLSGYDATHPLRLAADGLPAHPDDYTAAQADAVRQALTAMAQEHLVSIAADRAITYPNDSFTPLPLQEAQMGELPALTFGFVHTDEAGEVVERYVYVIAFDPQVLYWFGINSDQANVPTFVSDEALVAYAAAFVQTAANFALP